MNTELLMIKSLSLLYIAPPPDSAAFSLNLESVMFNLLIRLYTAPPYPLYSVVFSVNTERAILNSPPQVLDIAPP